MAPVKILMALPLIGPATNHKVGEEQNRQDELFNLLPPLKLQALSVMIVSVRPFSAGLYHFCWVILRDLDQELVRAINAAQKHYSDFTTRNYGKIRQIRRLSTLHIIEWGIPDKILQNAVQMRWS